MKHHVITQSLIGLWKEPLLELPVFDRQFYLDFFGDPYTTTFGLGEEGFVIEKKGASARTKAVLSPLRLAVTAPTSKEVAKASVKMAEALSARLEGKKMSFRAAGFNSEHEWLELESPAEDWIAKTLLSDVVGKIEGASETAGLEARLRFSVPEPPRTYTLLFQPRVDVEKGLFLDVNDHRELSKSRTVQKLNIEDELNKSLSLLYEQILPAFGLEAGKVKNASYAD